MIEHINNIKAESSLKERYKRLHGQNKRQKRELADLNKKIEKFSAENNWLKEKLKNLVKKSEAVGLCEAFTGDFRKVEFVGCKIFRSDDPNEVCLRCEILAIEKALGGK